MENLIYWLAFMVYVTFVIGVLFILTFLLVVGRHEFREVDFFEKQDAKAAKKAAKQAAKAARK